MDLEEFAESTLVGPTLVGVVSFLIALELLIYLLQRRTIDLKESAERVNVNETRLSRIY